MWRNLFLLVILSLTLKTFLTRYLYINVGYRLGEFRDPQNLMLGLGVRL